MRERNGRHWIGKVKTPLAESIGALVDQGQRRSFTETSEVQLAKLYHYRTRRPVDPKLEDTIMVSSDKIKPLQPVDLPHAT